MRAILIVLLMPLLTIRILCAADLVVEKAPDFDPLDFSKLELWTLFEPTTALQPTFSSDGSKATFTNLAPGKYAVVCWAAMTTWKGSPVYDATIDVTEGQPLKHRVAEAGKLTKLVVQTEMDLDTMFDQFTFVPCRIQRLEPPFAPSFAFRWVSLAKLGGKRFEGDAVLVPGRYVLVIPYPSGREGWPPPRRRPYEGDVPFLAMPFDVPKGDVAGKKQASGVTVEVSRPAKARSGDK